MDVCICVCVYISVLFPVVRESLGGASLGGVGGGGISVYVHILEVSL